MSEMETSTAEQLWYTWSDVGLSTVHAGFRIRAASPGLTEIYSERVQGMDRYMRYVLPPGTDRFAITPDMAPVCLAFIRTNWNNEYILVHKNYAGEDGVGRLGNFFVHVIALGELSHSFSAEDAIWLWDSDIWETSGKEKDRRSNDLETIPLKILQSEIDNFQPNFAQVRQYLPFLIEAYLSRKNRSPLYIATPAHNSAMIASLVAGLVNCLPRQLLTGLTFSTYEPDVTKASTEIIGTSWIATPGKEVDAAQVFSPQFYQEKLAVNCYTRERSSLQGHPQITHKPWAADFAAYATECLLTDNVDQLYALLELAEKSQTLDVDLFLRMYYNEIANTDSIVEADIEKYLADPYLRIDRLCNRNFRKRIIERAGENGQWSKNHLQPLLLALREQAQRESAAASSVRMQNKNGALSAEQAQSSSSSPQGLKRRRRNNAATQTKKNQVTLAEALALLADRALPDIIEAMKKVGARKETVPGQSEAEGLERQKKTETVATLLSLMDCCLIPQNSFDVWKQLFDQITQHPNGSATAFLLTHLGIFLWLIEKWDDVFPIQPEYDNAIRPVLIIPWNRLGKFLQLGLRQRHQQWNIFAVERLIKDTTLTPQVAQELEQNSSKEITDLLAQLSQEPDLTIASSFAIRLIEKGYLVKPPFAALIERILAQLIHSPQLWPDAKDLVATLTLTSYVGTEPYLDLVETLLSSLLTHRQASTQALGLELINLLVEQRYPRKTKLVDLLLKSNTSYTNLESIFAQVYRAPGELNTFFINDGSHYLSTPDQVRAMISLYKRLLQVLPRTQKLERLFVLLDAQLAGNTILDENTTVYLLDSTPLEGYESARILERYGNSYLKTFQQTPQLANKVVAGFIQLIKLGYPDKLQLLLTLFTSTANYKLLEELLSSAQLSVEESLVFFRKYRTSSNYFPFFSSSAIAFALFAKLAQAANTLAGNGQTELAKEKMALVLAWLDPSTQLRRKNEVEKILHSASLTPTEQLSFLERYGEAYLSNYPRLPLFNEYISTYITAFNVDSLDRAETKSFFLFLTRTYQSLPLDEGTQKHIQCWVIIDNYLTSPNTRPEMLKNLARALYTLSLPNNSAFITKLAKGFASCVKKGEDLYIIMRYMQQVPKIQNSIAQLLYVVAEQTAELYRQQPNPRQLLPCLSFVPDIPQEQQRHFAKEFFDTLLYRINVLDLDQWKTLDALLTQQGLSHEAQEQWNDYLKGLDLLNRLQSAEAMGNSVVVPEAQSQITPATPADDPQSLSWFARPKYYWTVYRPAKRKLKSALKSRKVDLIAEAWGQCGRVIDKFHSKRITPEQREQIEASSQFVQCCRFATANPNSSISIYYKIDELTYKLVEHNLTISADEDNCIELARKRIQAEGTRQPYQNPLYTPSGSLPAGQVPTSPTGTQNRPDMKAKQSIWPWKKQRALDLGPVPPSSNISGQQSQSTQSSINFASGLEDGRTNKKKRH